MRPDSFFFADLETEDLESLLIDGELDPWSNDTARSVPQPPPARPPGRSGSPEGRLAAIESFLGLCGTGNGGHEDSAEALTVRLDRLEALCLDQQDRLREEVATRRTEFNRLILKTANAVDRVHATCDETLRAHRWSTENAINNLIENLSAAQTQLEDLSRYLGVSDQRDASAA